MASVALAGPAASQPARGGDVARERIVLQHAPVEETAASLRELFALGGKSDAVALLEVTTDRDQHTIEISGERATVASVRKLLGEIDAAGVSSGRTIGIEMAIFEVMVPVEDVATISQEKLSDAAATEEGLGDRLATMGASRLVDRVSQRVEADGESQITYKYPPPSTQPIDKLPQAEQIREWNRLDRRSGEFLVRCRSGAGAGRTLRIRGKIGSNRESAIDVGNGVHAATYHAARHDWSGPIEPGRPILLIATGPGDNGNSPLCMSVIRLVVRE
jgi:hypothetical protein